MYLLNSHINIYSNQISSSENVSSHTLQLFCLEYTLTKVGHVCKWLDLFNEVFWYCLLNTVHGCKYTCCYIFVFDKNMDCTTALCLLCLPNECLFFHFSSISITNSQWKMFWSFMAAQILKIGITLKQIYNSLIQA